MRFIYNEPALFHHGALIIGDTHFGIEESLARKGTYDEKFSENILNHIIRLVDKTHAKKLIILGDVKDNITSVDETTKNIFEKLSKKIAIEIVRGNHDGGIEKLASGRIDIIPSSGFVYEKLSLIHGHSWPAPELMDSQYLISAHQHPQVQFIDKLGKRHAEPVWLFLPQSKKEIERFYDSFNKKLQLILMPAFNPLVGSPLKLDVQKHLGPLLNNKLFKYNSGIFYRLNGICLGSLKSLQSLRSVNSQSFCSVNSNAVKIL